MNVIFENIGEVDVRAIVTLGVSVKNEGAIGFFGSGASYSIAVILRSGCSVTFYSGTNKYEFTTKQETVRGKDFNIVYMNDTPLGFTTELGKTWEPWMAVRELLCNCKDEGGSWYKSEENVTPEAGKTFVVVSGKSFEEAYDKRDEFILSNKKLLWSNGNLEVYAGSSGSLFYKGVRVYTNPKPFMFTYNILEHVSLTEDRTVKYNFYVLNYQLALNLAKCEDKGVVNTICTIGKEYAEFHIDYDSATPGEVMASRVQQTLGRVDQKCPPSLQKVCKPSLSEQLSEAEGMELDPLEQSQMDKAIAFLTQGKVYDDSYPIKVVKDLGEGVMGLADRKTNTIFISAQCFEHGTKYLAATLYEEWLHLKYGVDDYTRGFQDATINHLMTAIERLNGEAL